MARAAAVVGLALQAGLAAGNLRGLTSAKTCGALFCAESSVCCDQAPAALCGSPGSTCCYNPGKTIANLCAPGSRCIEATGDCQVGGWPFLGSNGSGHHEQEPMLNASAASGGCADENPQCPGWAARGECEKNPWMPQHCPLSCDQCRPQPPAGPPQPPVWPTQPPQPPAGPPQPPVGPPQPPVWPPQPPVGPPQPPVGPPQPPVGPPQPPQPPAQKFYECTKDGRRTGMALCNQVCKSFCAPRFAPMDCKCDVNSAGWYQVICTKEQGRRIPVQFCNPHTCKCNGMSADLQGKAHGQEIDDYDTVIRVNRIPTSDYIVDFGARTDILFTAPQYFKTSGLYYFDFGGKMRHCSYYDDDCPINTFVLKGVDVKEWGHHSFAHLFPRSSPGWLPSFSKFAVSRQDERFDALASHLLNYTGEPGTRPTTGFQAVLTFAVACKTLKIYGFSGTTNADDHEVTSFHNLTMEHLVVHKFVSGNLTQDIIQFFPEYGRCLEHKLQSRR